MSIHDLPAIGELASRASRVAQETPGLRVLWEISYIGRATLRSLFQPSDTPDTQADGATLQSTLQTPDDQI